MTFANTRAEPETLRLPDLQARYIEVIGEDTRCPNKGWLIRKIQEALIARPAGTTSAPTQDETLPELDSQTRAEVESIDEDWDVRVAVPDTEFTDTSNAAEAINAVERDSNPEPELRASVLERGRLASLTVEELQTKYIEIVGRATTSTHRGYLSWKIKEAAKGRVTVRAARPQRALSETRKTKTIPLGFAADALHALDEAWKRQQLPSRSELFRRALAIYLRHVGEAQAAAFFKFGNGA